MAVAFSNLTKGNNNNVSGSSFTTASVTPTTNDLILLSVSARRGDSTNPTTPSVTGNGLTWVQIGTDLQFDTAGSSRKTFFLFRALGTASAGTIVINFGAQTITNATWIVDDVSGIDTSGTNGSGAIVQTNSHATQTGAQTSESVTLSAFGSSNNYAYGVFSNDTGNNSWVVGSGFSLVISSPDSNSMDNISEDKINTTTVNATFTNVAGVNSGVIAVEIKAAAVAATAPAGLRTLLGVGM
jgi:hypothetical protein